MLKNFIWFAHCHKKFGNLKADTADGSKVVGKVI